MLTGCGTAVRRDRGEPRAGPRASTGRARARRAPAAARRRSPCWTSACRTRRRARCRRRCRPGWPSRCRPRPTSPPTARSRWRGPSAAPRTCTAPPICPCSRPRAGPVTTPTPRARLGLAAQTPRGGRRRGPLGVPGRRRGRARGPDPADDEGRAEPGGHRRRPDRAVAVLQAVRRASRRRAAAARRGAARRGPAGAGVAAAHVRADPAAGRARPPTTPPAPTPLQAAYLRFFAPATDADIAGFLGTTRAATAPGPARRGARHGRGPRGDGGRGRRRRPPGRPEPRRRAAAAAVRPATCRAATGRCSCPIRRTASRSGRRSGRRAWSCRASTSSGCGGPPRRRDAWRSRSRPFRPLERPPSAAAVAAEARTARGRAWCGRGRR